MPSLSWTTGTPQRWTSSTPREQDSYTKLRTELLNQLPFSKEQRGRRLLTLEEIGDHKPSQFLRHLRSLVPDLPDYFLFTIWTS
jgi:hypothetical protein